LVNGFSDSFKSGIILSGATATNNTIAGNYVGTNYAGTAAVPNYYGVRIVADANSNTIGGTTASDRNVVSGNSEIGIAVVGAGSSSNIIRGNYVGTDRLGSSSVGNKDGIELSGATGNTIGGTNSSHRNVVSGNSGTGIDLGGADGNTISANFVGTTADGMSPLGNLRGIWIASGSQSNTIGGTSAGERNLISGNNFLGLLIAHVDTSLNVVQGNFIGTDVTGIAALPNTNEGIQLAFSAVNNTIGGTHRA
jgi:hypothetical protein